MVSTIDLIKAILAQQTNNANAGNTAQGAAGRANASQVPADLAQGACNKCGPGCKQCGPGGCDCSA